MIKWLKDRRKLQKHYAEEWKVIPIEERIEQRRLKLIEENQQLDAKAIDDVIENLWMLAHLMDGNLFKHSKNITMANALIDSYIVLKAYRMSSNEERTNQRGDN